MTVRDDEHPVVTVASAADAVAEGADVVFTLTRVGDRSVALEVSVQVTEAGSALADAPPASATFGAGDATATLRLGTEDDTRRDDPDPVVTLTLVDGTEYDLGAPSRATVTVRDNDTSTEVSIADAEPVTEGGTLEFPVTLTRPYDQEITVLYQLNQDPAATAKGSDYTDVTVAHARREFRFAPGEVRKVVSLRTVDDDSYEGEETVSVDIFVNERHHGDPPRIVALGRILGQRHSGRHGGGGCGHGHRRRGRGLHPDENRGYIGRAGCAGHGDRCRCEACRRAAGQRELRGRGRHPPP